MAMIHKKGADPGGDGHVGQNEDPGHDQYDAK
jgi:hypothetical protein